MVQRFAIFISIVFLFFACSKEDRQTDTDDVFSSGSADYEFSSEGISSEELSEESSSEQESNSSSDEIVSSSESSATIGQSSTKNESSFSEIESSSFIDATEDSYSSHTEYYAVDFGPNVKIYSPEMDMQAISNEIQSIHAGQANDEFSANRFALLFKPGTYQLTIDVGYYMHAAGLGLLPSAVKIEGSVQSVTTESSGNITTQFWRMAENFEVHPEKEVVWAVSQAAPYRRMHVKGDLLIDMGSGYASGGFLANSVIEGTVTAFNQQQWFTRNTEVGGWSGVNWNVVWVGVPGAREGWTSALSETAIDEAPIMREKPTLYIDDIGNYSVYVPDVSYNVSGTHWRDGELSGEHIPISAFYIASPGDAVTDINAELAKGKHLILTPGVYNLTDAIAVKHPKTVVLGLGLPTLVPQHGGAALTAADESGIVLAGLVIDAGPTSSETLLQIGEPGSNKDHSDNPILVSDYFCRIGGQFSGRAERCITINSNNVIGDHFWLWRADHGAGVNWDDNNRGSNWGWEENKSAHGLVVNGDDVTVYGLFNEHFQEYQTLWNGNRGQTYFYQSEIPYDPPSQESWMNGAVPGYPAYKVGDGVTEHEAYGLGMYSFFYNEVRMANAVETPEVSGMHIEDIVTVTFSDAGGGMENVVNNQGGPTNNNDMRHFDGYFGP
ncbi:MAG: coagulation factor 5/8 type domain-containing protein [Fibrobacterales bacterium]